MMEDDKEIIPSLTQERGKRKSWFSRHWDDKRKGLAHLRQTGVVTVNRQGGRLIVNAPFNDEFRRGANDLGAIYLGRTQRWSFLGKQRRLLAELIYKCYGLDQVPPPMRGLIRPE